MSGKKSILIVSDGTEKVNKMANDIAEALKGNNISLKDALSFRGTDLLPADVLFFGCEEPSPSSFDYLELLLQHINLAGRPLGIFSPDSKDALKYLSRISIASEAVLYPEPFITDNAGNSKIWAAKVLDGQK